MVVNSPHSSKDIRMPGTCPGSPTRRASSEPGSTLTAANAAPLRADDLKDVLPKELTGLVFTPHPSTRIVRSAYPAVAIFAANRIDGPVIPVRSSDARDGLVTRPEGDVTVRLLPKGGDAFLTRLVTGVPLGIAPSAAFAEAPSFDLAAYITGMIEAGAFVAVHMEAPS
jgi:hypothetical protein